MPLVQGALNSGTGAALSSKTVTLASPVGSGNMVCGYFGVFSPSAGSSVTISITDDKGNAYTVAISHNNGTYSYKSFNYYGLNITNAPTAITATLSGGTATFFAAIADEFSGVATSSALDQVTAQDLTGQSAADSITSGIVTTTTNGQLIYGSRARFLGTSIAIGTGETLTEAETPGGGGNADVGSEYKIQSSAGAVASTWSPSGSVDATATVMTFKAAAGGGAAVAARKLPSLGVG